MKTAIKEIRNTSTLYEGTFNRCYRVIIHHGTRQATFHVFTGMGWTSIDQDFALRFLFGEAENGEYPSFARWDEETGYSKQLGRETAKRWFRFCKSAHDRLLKLLGDELYSTLDSQYNRQGE